MGGDLGEGLVREVVKWIRWWGSIGGSRRGGAYLGFWDAGWGFGAED